MEVSGVSYEWRTSGEALVCAKNQRHGARTLCRNSFANNFLCYSWWIKCARDFGRTQGNLSFAIFYEIFVLACFVHAPIGVANILQETFPKTRLARPISGLLALLILVLGTVAVFGVYTGGAR